MHPPERFEMKDVVDDNGNMTVVLTWKEFQDSIYKGNKNSGSPQ